jgi:hypothetical protein
MKDEEFEFVIFDPAVSPSENWELYKALYIDPYPEKKIIKTKFDFETFNEIKKTPKK